MLHWLFHIINYLSKSFHVLQFYLKKGRWILGERRKLLLLRGCFYKQVSGS